MSAHAGPLRLPVSLMLALVLSFVVMLDVHAVGQDKEHQKPLPPPGAGALPDSMQKAHPDSTQKSHPDSTQKARPDSVLHFDLRRWAGSMMLSTDTAGAITATAMEWQTPVSLSDIIANLPGIYMTDPASIGQYQRPYARGIDWRGTAVLVDGLPMNDPVSGGLNLSMIPGGMADRIETAIGTRSFMYGTGATGAVFNIVRPRVSRVKPVTRIRYEESDYTYATSDGMFVQDISQRVNVQAGYQYQGTTGRFDNSGHEQWNLRGDVRYHPARNWDLTAHYLYTQTQTGLNEGIDLTQTGSALAFSTQQAIVRNPDAYEKITRHDLAVQLSGSFTDDSTARTSVSAYRSQWLREYRDEENRTTPNGLYLAQDHRVARTGLQLRQRFERGPETITFGLSLDDQRITSSTVLDSRATTYLATSFMHELAFGERNLWALYGRADFAQEKKVYFGAGSDVRLAVGQTLSLTAGAALMERPPDFAEAWNGHVLSTLFADRKERHALLQAGLEFDLGRTGTAKVTYAYRSIRNYIRIANADIVFAGTAPGDSIRPWLEISQLDGETKLHSLDLDLNLRFAWFWFEGTAGIVHWENLPDNTHDAIPRGYARGGVYYRNRILNDELELQVGARGLIQGRYYGTTVLGEHLLPLTNTKTQLGAASSLDLVLIAHIGDAYIHVLWENVTNVQYFTTPFTPALGRRFRFGVSWEFLN